MEGDVCLFGGTSRSHGQVDGYSFHHQPSSNDPLFRRLQQIFALRPFQIYSPGCCSIRLLFLSIFLSSWSDHLLDWGWARSLKQKRLFYSHIASTAVARDSAQSTSLRDDRHVRRPQRYAQDFHPNSYFQPKMPSCHLTSRKRRWGVKSYLK